jgi:hypothetical protein
VIQRKASTRFDFILPWFHAQKREAIDQKVLSIGLENWVPAIRSAV